jgi:putative phosphoserine phosphatase/1-acylglycerol-3-phosphate O-acyltransferase
MSDFSYTAFYDLDHTILDGNSATHLVQEARSRGVMSNKQFRHALWLSILYKLRIGEPTEMINRMLSWLQGLDEEFIMQLSKEIFEQVIKNTIRSEILETIREHRANNAAVVLLSSATTPICEPVSQFLQMDDIICTQLESKNGILTGRTIGKLVYGPEKRARMIQYCEKQGFAPNDAWYYGDSFTDRHVMEAVGHPVAVYPDNRLMRYAKRNSWAILGGN